MLFFIVIATTRPHRSGITAALSKGLCVDPEDLGLSLKLFTFKLIDGTELVGWRAKRKISPGEQLPKVILHGWGGSRWSYVEQMAQRAQDHCEVIVFDQRGCGDSDGVSTMGRSEPDDLKQLLDYLQINEVIVEGWSAGASCAVNYSVLDSDRVKGIDLVAPFLDGTVAWKAKLKQFKIYLGPVVHTYEPFLKFIGCLPVGLPSASILPEKTIRVVSGENDLLTQHEKLADWCAETNASLIKVVNGGHIDEEVVKAAYKFFSSS